MKLQNLTVIFIIIIIPVILLVSLYITTGLRTIKYQSLYDTGLLTATHDAIYAFELNTSNDDYAQNPEIKRDILKSSVKMFEKSLANTCGISSYNTEEIEEYIPAIVFGMYDGFYMYAPSLKYNKDNQKEYTHSLKNYVYYSETLKGLGKDGSDIVIRYSLDNYVVVSGNFDGNYEVKQGYLIVEDRWEDYIDSNVSEAKSYYDESKVFTEWFNDNIGNKEDYLKIDSGNDPEDETSSFVQHKRTVIKGKIEGVLNSSITAYSERVLGRDYKMPKLSEEDWQKIYDNISMITFFQGKRIGLTKYNGYCVLNSTNSNEYVNPNLMYFIDETGYYHDIRCGEKGEQLTGYKIGSFAKKREEQIDPDTNQVKTDVNGNTLYKYTYKHDELACYYCINGQINNTNSVQQYIKNEENKEIKIAYYTSLARERYNTVKLTNDVGIQELTGVTEIKINVEGLEHSGAQSLKLKLLKNGIHDKDIIIDNNWQILIDNLEAYENNVKITYTLSDVPAIVGYGSPEITLEGNTYTIKYNSCSHSTYKNGICETCGEECEHSWYGYEEGHYCYNCYAYKSHTYNDSKCTVCKYECKQHSWEYGRCVNCSKVCSHNYTSDTIFHGCSICGNYGIHNWSPTGKCSECKRECEHSKYQVGADNKHCVNCGKKMN